MLINALDPHQVNHLIWGIWKNKKKKKKSWDSDEIR
jgi:hypothetical protein